jgi:hypothetical protein
MINKEQAGSLLNRQEVHYHTAGQKCVKARVNGAMRTWKTRPAEFRVPLKVGFNGYSEIVPSNANSFYLPSECPCRTQP